MSKAYDPRLPEDPGIDESEILFDDGDSPRRASCGPG
jgi:hypothetical protein